MSAKEHLSGSASPTERELAYLREAGYEVDICTRRLTRVVTVDLFGFADLAALHHDYPGTTYIQVTDTSNLAKRVAKALAEPRARMAVDCGNRVWCVGWSKWDSTGDWTRKAVEIRGDGPWCDGVPYRMRGGKVSIAP